MAMDAWQENDVWGGLFGKICKDSIHNEIVLLCHIHSAYV